MGPKQSQPNSQSTPPLNLKGLTEEWMNTQIHIQLSKFLNAKKIKYSQMMLNILIEYCWYIVYCPFYLYKMEFHKFNQHYPPTPSPTDMFQPVCYYNDPVYLYIHHRQAL